MDAWRRVVASPDQAGQAKRLLTLGSSQTQRGGEARAINVYELHLSTERVK